MKWLQRVVLGLALAVVVPAAAGCAALLSALPVVSTVVTDAMSVLEVIDVNVQEWFRQHPDQDAVRRAYLDAYARAVNALNAASHALAGVKNVTQQEFDAAFADFRQAFYELRNVLVANRLMVGDQLMVGQTTIVVPEPEALTYRVW